MCKEYTTAYLIGSMNDDPEIVKLLFTEAEKIVKHSGFKVENPHHFLNGLDNFQNLTLRMSHLSYSDLVVVIENYTEDKVARQELEYAIRHDLPIFNTRNLHLWKLNTSVI